MDRILLKCLAVCQFLVPTTSRKLRRAQSSTDNRPNIVWILADDLHYETAAFEKTPNLRRLKQESLEFINHVAQSPLCGPSRASILVGRFSHNSGYRNQDNPTPEFIDLQDHSVGKWLTNSGYYTAFLGKYVNGVAGYLGKDVPKGWRHFGAFTLGYDQFKGGNLGGAYNYYNASQWDLDYDETGVNLVQKENRDYPITIWNGIHQADFLASQTIDEANKAVKLGKPFFIFTNPVMIHAGNCEGPLPDLSMYKYDDPFLEKNQISPCPKRGRTGGPENFLAENLGTWLLHRPTSNFGKRAIGMPENLREKDIDSWSDKRLAGRRNRTLSLVDLDDMVGSIIRGLEQLGVIQSTYVIFSSDNGVHMGDHSFWFGKGFPYEHDIRVPLFIRTPNGASGVRTLPTTHIDVTRTIVDLTGAKGAVTPALEQLDGMSFMDALTNDVDVGSWRRFSYSEMFESSGNNTWRNIRFVGEDGKPEWSLHVWCTGYVEVYNLREDPGQLLNVLAPAANKSSHDFGKQIKQHWMPVINGMGRCVGSTCNGSVGLAKRIAADITHDSSASFLPCETFQRPVLGPWTSKLF